MPFTHNYALFLQIGIISTFLYDLDMKKSKFLEKIGKNCKIWVIFAKTAIFHDPICDLGFLSSDTPQKPKNLKISNFWISEGCQKSEYPNRKWGHEKSQFLQKSPKFSNFLQIFSKNLDFFISRSYRNVEIMPICKNNA